MKDLDVMSVPCPRRRLALGVCPSSVIAGKANMVYNLDCGLKMLVAAFLLALMLNSMPMAVICS